MNFLPSNASVLRLCRRTAMGAAFAAAFAQCSRAMEPLSVSPAFASVHVGDTQQFTAAFAGATSVAVKWQVNGILGGSAAAGKVTTAGLYTAPSAVPAGTTVTVTAVAAGVEPVSVVVAITTGLSFYVSISGKDTNPGTRGEPWRHIQYAATRAQAGDTVYVLGGTYHESVSLPRSGSARAGSIVFQSYPGEIAVIDGTGVPCCGDDTLGLLNLEGNKSYVVIEGFEVRNFTSNNVNNDPAGIYVTGSGSYIQILNNVVHGITVTAGKNGNAHGIGFYGTSATPLTHITLSGNTLYGMKTGNSETVTFDGNIVGFTATDNLVHDNDNIGIVAAGFYSVGPSGHDQARNGVISGNTVYNITSIHNPAYSGYAADGIYCDGCTEVSIARNLVYNCDLDIEAASENPGRVTSYVTIANNVVYGGNLAGISIGGYDSTVGGSDHITVVNNTLYNCNRTGDGGDFQIQYHATNNLFENNIVYAGSQGVVFSGQYDSTPSPVTSDYNIYYTLGTVKWTYQGTDYYSLASFQAASGLDKHSHFENPGLASVALPYNFDLSATSPAHGAGNYSLGAAVYGALDFAGNPRTIGSTISIGAYER